MTPWTSDTLWGHMLWGIRYQQGEQAFEKLLKAFNTDKEVPWIISDAFPQNKLPIIRTDRGITPLPCCKKEAILTEQVVGLLDEIQWIDTDLFEEMRNGLTLNRIYEEVLVAKRCPITLKTPKIKLKNIEQVLKQMALYRDKTEERYCTTHTVVKNSINRLTGTAGEDGGLYTQTEYTYHKPLEVYMKIREDVDLTMIIKAIEYIEQTGYGKKASTGKGAIKTISFEKEEHCFRRTYEGENFIVLSSYMPKAEDYTDIVWSKSHYKQGKVSSALGEHNVFKAPFRYYQAGSIFEGIPNNHKGKMLKGLHENTNIIQYGIPFVVGVKK